LKPIDYIHRCIELAAQGKGWVNPNPLVGCVIVHDGKIIAEGWHKAFGQPHAEKMAIDGFLLNGGNPELLAESELYVSLEPCSHFGKTPPCADLVVKYGFKKVYVSLLDPNKLVAGKGIEKLNNAGIVVEVGLGKELAIKQNRFFLSFHEKNRPYIILKWAETLDGFIAPESRERLSISGLESQKYVHALRQECSAILVGSTTWIVDKPELTDRYFGGPQPVKFVLSSKNNVEEFIDFHWVNTTGDLVEKCMNLGLNSVLVEGGSKTLNTFISDGLFDEVHIIKSKIKALEKGIKGPEFNLKIVKDFTMNSIENPNDVIEVYKRK